MPFKNVFVSYFNITLKNKAYETEFRRKMWAKNKISNPIITTICCLLLILMLVETLLALKDKKEQGIEAIVVTLIRIAISGGLMIMIIIFQIFFKSNHLFQIVVTNINYFTFSFNIYFLRKIYFHFFNKDTQLINISIYINFLIQYAWLFFGLIDFKDTFISNIILITLTTTLNSAIPGWWNNEVYNTIISHILRITLITYSYFSMRNARYVLYYSKSLENINEWYKNVLDNINSGFLKVTNGKIVYGNRYELEWLYKIGIISESDLTKSNIQEILGQKSMIIIDNIINNTNIADQTENDKETTNTEKDKDKDTKLHFKRSESSTDLTHNALLEKMKRFLNTDEQKGKFAFVGNGTFLHSLPEYTFIYELYARRYHNESGDNIEMILKDITRNQIIKTKNEEFKVKSIFLSKLFHEFKNPMLCLSEMVEEEMQKVSSINENTRMIKSLISYLLILVKDLDHFAEMQKDCNNNTNNKSSNSQMNITKFSITALINFVYMITKYLLKKLKKDKVLSFKIITNNVPNEIETDEIKLKQVLINLISNAIKFTNAGSVILEIEKEEDENYIRFSVNDTGEGIPFENQPQLFGSFCSFKKIGEINSYGAGLGLTITKDISTNLGKSIEFTSTPGQGSSFWFSIRTSPPQEDIEEHSLSTICLDNPPLEINKLLVPRSARSAVKKIKTYNILIVDDEELIRKTTKRLLNEYAKRNNISINIIEATDGIEVLWNVYRNYDQNGHKVTIDIIISDENMVLFNGQSTAKKLKKIEDKLKIKHIQYYLSSANTIPLDASDQIDGFLHKPLISSDLSRIFKIFFL